jgi:DNA polymerase-3 subunit epsilon
LEVSEDFINFIKNKKLIIHNAPFDLSFLNYELCFIKKEKIEKINVIDTLEIARAKFPGAQNSLDALCKRFNIDNSKREKHSALVDCNLLKEVYINLVDQKSPKLKLESVGYNEIKSSENNKKKNVQRKIIKPTTEEIELHKKFLKSSLAKNYYN